MRIGALFAGYGGLERAVSDVLGGELAWVSEIDPGACAILAHHWPDVPNLGDITTVDWSTVEPVDILTGGSPCQDLSHAGRRAGMTEGTRSNLWVSMREAIAAIRPSLVIWENVRGAMSAEAASGLEFCPGCMGDTRDRGPVLRALGRVLGDLASLGYDAQWHGLRVADLGGCHGRWRVFVVAYPQHSKLERVGQLSGLRSGLDARADMRRVMPESNGLTVLPTPTASVANDGEGTDTWLARRERVKLTAANGNGMGMPLTIAVQLLPTLSAIDASGGAKRLRTDGRTEADHGPALRDVAAADHRWGQYAAAIASHEHLTGRPAPEPTELGPKGKPRLSARFVEWMMCLPDGWVTDVPGITRNEALKALGNGVVPPQAAAALRWLLTPLEAA